MNANTSFVCLDPKGELLRDTGNLLKAKGYDIKVIDLINMEKSYCSVSIHLIHPHTALGPCTGKRRGGRGKDAEADVLRSVKNLGGRPLDAIMETISI